MAVDNSLKEKEKPPKRELTPPRKRQNQNLPYRYRTENRRLIENRGGTEGNGTTKTNPKPRIAAAERRLVWPKGSLSARPRPEA